MIRERHPDDLPAVESLWRSRVRWAAARGIGPIRYTPLAVDGRDCEPVVLTCDGVIVASAVIVESAPGGTAALPDESHRAVEILRVITDPDLAAGRLSWVLASWIRDRASRAGHEWVQALVAPQRLAAYWCRERGWQEVRLVRTTDGGTARLLRIRAERIAGHALVKDRTDQRTCPSHSLAGTRPSTRSASGAAPWAETSNAFPILGRTRSSPANSRSS